jgi:phosphoribosylamine--glycine ligase
MLEASKEFAKDFMLRHHIPTAGHRVAGSRAEALEAITAYPVVLKFDGLAAGKGVAVCQTGEQAGAFLDEVFVERRFGEGRLIVEDCLFGPEISIFASVSGTDYQLLMAARDYKRIGDGDTGPNTGGMGAVASLGIIPPGLLSEIDDSIVKATVTGLARDGLSYRGFLYFGIMLTAEGPKLLEYNCRFGDPEAEAVLPMVTGDFAEYLARAARGHLDPSFIGFRTGWSLCVILASAGYPESSRSGDPINGLEKVESARVFHCGTKLDSGGGYVTNGGRVLAVVHHGENRLAAVEAVEREHRKIHFDGAQRRSDIGRLHFEGGGS